MSLDTQKHSYDGENEEHEKACHQEHLGYQHGLRALTGLAFGPEMALYSLVGLYVSG